MSAKHDHAPLSDEESEEKGTGGGQERPTTSLTSSEIPSGIFVSILVYDTAYCWNDPSTVYPESFCCPEEHNCSNPAR
jgi:hypothetical protein